MRPYGERTDRRAPSLPPTGLGTRAPGGRLQWMDLLRGLAIVLVVVNHAARVVESRGLDAPDVVDRVNAVLSPVRIPTLVFLSGLLLAPSMAKGVRRYLDGKARGVLYPFLVWSVVYLVVLTRPWSYGDPYDPLALLEIVVTAPSPLWFLGFLALYYVMALAVRRVPAPLVVAATLLVSAACPDDSRVQRFFFLFGFFLLGDLVTRHPDVWRRWAADPVVTAGCAVLTALLVVRALQVGEAVRYQAEYALAVAAAVLLLALAADRVAGARVLGPLGHLGRGSLVLYVVHYPVLFVTVKALQVLGDWPPLVLFLAASVTGLASGLVALALARRWPVVDLLFTLPRARTAASRSS